MGQPAEGGESSRRCPAAGEVAPWTATGASAATGPGARCSRARASRQRPVEEARHADLWTRSIRFDQSHEGVLLLVNQQFGVDILGAAVGSIVRNWPVLLIAVGVPVLLSRE